MISSKYKFNSSALQFPSHSWSSNHGDDNGNQSLSTEHMTITESELKHGGPLKGQGKVKNNNAFFI